MSDREALNVLIEAIHQVSLDCDNNTFGVLSLALEDANRLRTNPHRSQTVNPANKSTITGWPLTNIPAKPAVRGWLQ